MKTGDSTDFGQAEVGATDVVSFREPLPDRCPPEDAPEVRSDVTVFRLISSNVPCDDDFRSQRAEKPNVRFRVDECFARGVSVSATRADAEIAKRLPALRSKIVCAVSLAKGAGFLQPTFKPGHRTWWPFKGYDILSRCEVMS